MSGLTMSDALRPEGLVRECTCGSNNFERVVVHRPRAMPYETDFVACAECRVMYYSPKANDPPAPASMSVAWRPAPR
jgi:hypothetical protein